MSSHDQDTKGKILKLLLLEKILESAGAFAFLCDPVEVRKSHLKREMP